MIKHLNGTRETVDYEEIPYLRIYRNVEFEEYPIHWHPAIEIIMPIASDYQVEISGEMHLLKPGDILAIAPGVLHRLLPTRGERLILLMDPGVFSGINKFDSILSFIQPSFLISEEENEGIHKRCQTLLKHAMSSYFGSEPFKEMDIFSDLLKVVSLIGRSFTTENLLFNNAPGNKQQEYIEKFIELCEYINSHCDEDITLQFAAERVGFSKYHFARRFKDFTGNTFYKYLNHCRISHAENLLLDKNLNITEVALSSGFNSISSFIRMFKIVKGCTPTDFKKMKRMN